MERIDSKQDRTLPGESVATFLASRKSLPAVLRDSLPRVSVLPGVALQQGVITDLWNRVTQFEYRRMGENPENPINPRVRLRSRSPRESLGDRLFLCGWAHGEEYQASMSLLTCSLLSQWLCWRCAVLPSLTGSFPSSAFGAGIGRDSCFVQTSVINPKMQTFPLPWPVRGSRIWSVYLPLTFWPLEAYKTPNDSP